MDASRQLITPTLSAADAPTMKSLSDVGPGSDIFQRRCPRCQGGMPGLPTSRA